MFAVVVFRVEDSDDLMPILNQLTDDLVDKYGDYYLAELIEAQDENMKCLVAEVQIRMLLIFLIDCNVHFKIQSTATVLNS